MACLSLKEPSITHIFSAEHRWRPNTAQIRKNPAKIKQLKLDAWLSVNISERVLSLTVSQDARAEESKLDGCYVTKTDLQADLIDTTTVHQRYQDLAKLLLDTALIVLPAVLPTTGVCVATRKKLPENRNHQ